MERMDGSFKPTDTNTSRTHTFSIEALKRPFPAIHHRIAQAPSGPSRLGLEQARNYESFAIPLR